MATAFVFAAAGRAYSWNGNEHRFIGTEGYHRACVAMVREYENTSDPERLARLHLACNVVAGNVTGSRYVGAFAYDSLMGEWSRLAADHTENPEQLTSIKLNDLVVDYGLFTRLVTSNYRHFQPASVVSWQEEHARALRAATDAAQHSGLDRVRLFESMLAVEAFAQHYLQDSFASGHMGFNRIASSNAAALTYHEAFNKSGRCVANQRGEVWYTYGDDNFKVGTPSANRIIEAAAQSFRDVLEVFILASDASSNAVDIWYSIPAYLNTYAKTETTCAPGQGWESLRTIKRPAEAVSTVELLSIIDKSIYRPPPRAFVIGISRDFIYTIPLGDRVVQSRILVAGGATVTEIGRRSYMAEYDYLWQLGTSMRGTITHEIGFGEIFFYLPRSRQYRSYRNDSAHFLYGMNVEAGRVFLRLLIGPGRSKYGLSGVHASAGIGYVRKAKQ